MKWGLRSERGVYPMSYLTYNVCRSRETVDWKQMPFGPQGERRKAGTSDEFRQRFSSLQATNSAIFSALFLRTYLAAQSSQHLARVFTLACNLSALTISHYAASGRERGKTRENGNERPRSA